MNFERFSRMEMSLTGSPSTTRTSAILPA